MARLEKLVKVESGPSQFRIKISEKQNAPLYTFYSQQELEDDLVDFKTSDYESRQIKTLDQVESLKTGDVVFSLISGKATIVREVHDGYLLTLNYVKLTPDKKVDSKYLVYVLNESKNIEKQLIVGLQGSNVLKYSIRQVRELELEKIPSMEKQKLIGEIYFNQLKLQRLKERVANLETKILLEKIRRLK